MSLTTEAKDTKLSFRRFKDGDTKVKRWQDNIFQASWSHKCPTYIQSTPPCQGSCPSGALAWWALLSHRLSSR